MTGQLNPTDLVGMSFWIISAAMVAATFFFWVERDRASCKMENIINCCRFGNGYCCDSLFLYERSMGRDWSFATCISLCRLAINSATTNC